jgi:ssDNA-binding Zn-finger/Zn-ribbon topoisomerase 1
MALPYLIYVRTCPVCGEGLCRVRVCTASHHLVGCVICDECESVWKDPEMQTRSVEKDDAYTASCPECGMSLWDDACHWADIQEVCLLGWYDKVKVART